MGSPPSLLCSACAATQARVPGASWCWSEPCSAGSRHGGAGCARPWRRPAPSPPCRGREVAPRRLDALSQHCPCQPALLPDPLVSAPGQPALSCFSSSLEPLLLPLSSSSKASQVVTKSPVKPSRPLSTIGGPPGPRICLDTGEVSSYQPRCPLCEGGAGIVLPSAVLMVGSDGCVRNISPTASGFRVRCMGGVRWPPCFQKVVE